MTPSQIAYTGNVVYQNIVYQSIVYQSIEFSGTQWSKDIEFPVISNITAGIQDNSSYPAYAEYPIY